MNKHRIINPKLIKLILVLLFKQDQSHQQSGELGGLLRRSCS